MVTRFYFRGALIKRGVTITGTSKAKSKTLRIRFHRCTKTKDYDHFSIVCTFYKIFILELWKMMKRTFHSTKKTLFKTFQ